MGLNKGCNVSAYVVGDGATVVVAVLVVVIPDTTQR